MNQPQVSVVLPVYNGERFVEQAVNSILCQSFSDLELLVIDDGSSDNTVALLRCYEANDDRVRVIANGRKGLVRTLNEGLKRSRGSLIARMDADDIALPTRLEEQYRRFETDHDLWVLGTAVQVIDQYGKVIETHFVQTDPEKIAVTLLRASPIWHPTVMMRKNHIMSIGAYRRFSYRAEDYDLWLRVISAGGMISNLPSIGIQYRIHSGSFSDVYAFSQRVSAELARSVHAGREGCFLTYTADLMLRVGSKIMTRQRGG